MAKYLYNDVELPALPEWDKETYPYLTMYKGFEGHSIYATKEPCVVRCLEDTGEAISVIVPSPALYFKCSDGESWSDAEYEENVGGQPVVLFLIWSNHDVLKDYDGSVYLAASDPIPVLSLTDSDLYRNVNDKLTKLTLYKKVGGEFVPLDDHIMA